MESGIIIFKPFALTSLNGRKGTVVEPLDDKYNVRIIAGIRLHACYLPYNVTHAPSRRSMAPCRSWCHVSKYGALWLMLQHATCENLDLYILGAFIFQICVKREDNGRTVKIKVNNLKLIRSALPMVWEPTRRSTNGKKKKKPWSLDDNISTSSMWNHNVFSPF